MRVPKLSSGQSKFPKRAHLDVWVLCLDLRLEVREVLPVEVE